MNGLGRRLESLEERRARVEEPEQHQVRAAYADEARAYLAEHPDAEGELAQIYRDIDYYTWRNQWGGLSKAFVRRRREPEGDIAEVWQLSRETEDLPRRNHPRLAEIRRRLGELYAAADARVDSAIAKLRAYESREAS